MSIHVLVVDDERPIRDMVCFALRHANLGRADFACSGAASAEQAYQALAAARPDIILLDWMLPAMSGMDLLKTLRGQARYRDIPIIMLTAKTQQHDKLKGFAAGCDDYITKPFSTKELIARVKAVLKRTRRYAPDEASTEALVIDRLRLEPERRVALADGVQVCLRPTEYRLLAFFMRRGGRVFSRAQLLDGVWGEAAYLDERTVDVHIRRLREALAPHRLEHLVQTVRGAGYRFADKQD